MFLTQTFPLLRLIDIPNPHVAHYHETADGYRVAMEIPGIPPEAIQLDATDYGLMLKAEYEEDGVKRSFQHSITLPSDVDVEKVTASAKHGVLTVNLPKLVAKSRRIEIAC